MALECVACAIEPLAEPIACSECNCKCHNGKNVWQRKCGFGCDNYITHRVAVYWIQFFCCEECIDRRKEWIREHMRHFKGVK